jgi:2'-5' RNA ligase
MQYELAFGRDEVSARSRPKKSERLFFAVRPDEGVAIRAERIRDQFIAGLALTGTPLKTERLHISLCHAGDYTCLRTRHVYKATLAAKFVRCRRGVGWK